MVEIIPKPLPKPPSWLNTLFYISIVLLLIAISSFFILNQFQKKAAFTIQNLELLLTNTKTPERINLEKTLAGYQKNVENFSYLILNHKLATKLFSFLETITHPKIYFSNLSFSSGGEKLVLKGQTEDFQTLGQQFLIFKTEPLIKETNLAEVAMGKEGKIEFTFNLSLSSEIFK